MVLYRGGRAAGGRRPRVLPLEAGDAAPAQGPGRSSQIDR